MIKKLIDIGMVMAVAGAIFGIIACGYLANNEMNTRILLGFGCLFGVGMLLVGIGLIWRR